MIIKMGNFIESTCSSIIYYRVDIIEDLGTKLRGCLKIEDIILQLLSCHIVLVCRWSFGVLMWEVETGGMYIIVNVIMLFLIVNILPSNNLSLAFKYLYFPLLLVMLYPVMLCIC